MELKAFTSAVDDWLDEHARELACSFEGIGTLDEQMAQLRKVMRLTYDAGFMRMGWPERVGGLGGSSLLRAYLGEALTTRDLVEPGIYSMPEVLAPITNDQTGAPIRMTLAIGADHPSGTTIPTHFASGHSS